MIVISLQRDEYAMETTCFQTINQFISQNGLEHKWNPDEQFKRFTTILNMLVRNGDFPICMFVIDYLPLFITYSPIHCWSKTHDTMLPEDLLRFVLCVRALHMDLRDLVEQIVLAFPSTSLSDIMLVD